MEDISRQFYQDFDDYMGWVISHSPTFATVLGIHDYDDRLTDLSPAALEESYHTNKAYLAKFKKATGSEDRDTAVDAELAVSMLKNSIISYENLQHQFRLPDFYVNEAVFGPYSLISKDFAPLEERLNNLVKRLDDVPRVLEQGKKNLQHPPKIWTEIAVRNTQGGISFFKNTIPSIASQSPNIASKVTDKAMQAAESMKDYLHFLEDDLLPRSDGEFPVGEELWNKLVREYHMLDLRADEIEQIGYELIEQTRDEMDRAANAIAPGKDKMQLLHELRANHPQPDELLNTYRECMIASREFIMEHDLVTIPEGEKLDIEETPAFQKATLPFAAYLMPGPFEKKQQGVFWVTPVDPNLPDDERETRLRGHPYAKIAVTAVHEGYPGHHLQLVRGNKASTLPRKIGASTLFVEGWAFYCEEMMEHQGFLTDPAGKLFRLSDQLWRACRIVIDVGIHTKGMSVEEAINMLVEIAGLEKPDAVAEVRRYTQSPTQPMCYLIGKMELMKIADEYKARKGADFNLKAFHDELLSFGSLSPRLLKRMLYV